MLDDHELEHSPLSGQFTQDGITVEVEIYRIAGTQDPWWIEVVHISGGCTKWPLRFATEREAYEAFKAMIEADGIASFSDATTKERQ